MFSYIREQQEVDLSPRITKQVKKKNNQEGLSQGEGPELNPTKSIGFNMEWEMKKKDSMKKDENRNDTLMSLDKTSLWKRKGPNYLFFP